MRSASFLIRGWLSLTLDLWHPTHPIKGYQKTVVNFDLLCGLHEFSFDVSIICLLIIRDKSNVLVQFGILRRKYVWWEKLLWFDFKFIVHHFFETFLISFVAPRELSYTKVAQ